MGITSIGKWKKIESVTDGIMSWIEPRGHLVQQRRAAKNRAADRATYGEQAQKRARDLAGRRLVLGRRG